MKILSVSYFQSALYCPKPITGQENGHMPHSLLPSSVQAGFRCKRYSGEGILSSCCRIFSSPGVERLTVDRARGQEAAAVSLNVSDSVTEEADEEEDVVEEVVVGHSDQLERRLVSGERVLQISKADFTVSSVLDKIRRGRLDLRPSYQRDYVWDKRTASKLIESVLLNIPLPTMFFHERSQGQLEVVDGKQRLTSIWCFMETFRFPDGSDFALTGLEVLDELNGKKYKDLEEPLREVMQDFALNVHTISRHSDDDVVFEVFERLNMGSTQLNEQELRNCVFQGRYDLKEHMVWSSDMVEYNDLLEELSLHSDMLRAFRQEIPHKRMRDREFILRFFALRRSGIENFYLPVKNWLNNEMRRHQLLEEEDFKVMKFDFTRCIRLSVEVFGDQVFRMPRGQKYDSDPNVCLWDTIMYGFLRYRDDEAVLSKKKLLVLALNDLLVYNTEFKSNLVSTPKSLKLRTTKWLLVLNDLLGPSR